MNAWCGRCQAQWRPEDFPGGAMPVSCPTCGGRLLQERRAGNDRRAYSERRDSERRAPRQRPVPRTALPDPVALQEALASRRRAAAGADDSEPEAPTTAPEPSDPRDRIKVVRDAEIPHRVRFALNDRNVAELTRLESDGVAEGPVMWHLDYGSGVSRRMPSAANEPPIQRALTLYIEDPAGLDNDMAAAEAPRPTRPTRPTVPGRRPVRP